jgi:hypothetical protein
LTFCRQVRYKVPACSLQAWRKGPTGPFCRLTARLAGAEYAGKGGFQPESDAEQRQGSTGPSGKATTTDKLFIYENENISSSAYRSGDAGGRRHLLV